MPKRGTVQKICAADDCTSRAVARGYCAMHAGRLRVHGSLAKPSRRRPRPKCSVATCDQSARAHGWCGGHYARFRKTGDVQADRPLRPKKGKWEAEVCVELGCSAAVKVRDLCMKHYQERWMRKLSADPDKYAALLERARQAGRAKFQRAPEEVRAAQRAWRAKNPVAVKALGHRKRVLRQNARQIPFTAEQLTQRMAYWGNRCWMCGGPFEAIDHVKPLNKGGWHALMNLRPACMSDNSRKRDKWPFPVNQREYREGHVGRPLGRGKR